jgi:putative tricarboxylic transport membrane protein
MKKLGYSPAALVLALVLGPLAERALRQALIISDAGIFILFTRPISATLTALALVVIAIPVARAFLKRGQDPFPEKGS